MKILYEDNFLVIAKKPQGVPSQPDPSGRDDMVTLLSRECGCGIFCVHRLDTPTGGVMVYAKDSKTAGRLTAALSAENAVKEYVCAFYGKCEKEGSMKDLLFHDKRKNKAYVVDRQRSGVKEALLDYSLLSSNKETSLARVTLHTGRTHQIRVQFASRHLPLVGDGKYGAKDNMPLALYCFRLAFDHPVTGKRLDTVFLPESPWFSFNLDEIF
ncbi:MAG: RluA family pseudouridine synthase [Ruminococcaceae bacterium]|nr:RluA family pseudouridine synthase [Oscillospiraceae bacterium]